MMPPWGLWSPAKLCRDEARRSLRLRNDQWCGEPDWIAGRDFVQIGSGDVAKFGEFSFVPTRPGDPFTGLARGSFLADEFDGLADPGDFAQFEAIDPFGLVEMTVRVDQTRSGGAARRSLTRESLAAILRISSLVPMATIFPS